VSWFAAFLLFSGTTIHAQSHQNPLAEARIAGTVLDQQGKPLENISIHAVREQTGMYMPTVDSNTNHRSEQHRTRQLALIHSASARGTSVNVSYTFTMVISFPSLAQQRSRSGSSWAVRRASSDFQ
jgi:hypothetical protein